jgi:hypothetical protein
VLECFPSSVLAARHNRGLFFRVAHGLYLLNPALEIEVGGAGISAAERMVRPLLLDTIGPRADYLRRWISSASCGLGSADVCMLL